MTWDPLNLEDANPGTESTLVKVAGHAEIVKIPEVALRPMRSLFGSVAVNSEIH